MLADISEFGKLTRERASYDIDQLRLFATDSSGNVTESIVAAYYYLPNQSMSLDTTEQNVEIALAKAIHWATDSEGGIKTGH